jgi:hypothetical protein
MRNPFKRKPKPEEDEMAKIARPVVADPVVEEVSAIADTSKPERPDDAPEWFGIDLASAPDCAMGEDRGGSFVVLGSMEVRTSDPRGWQAAWREAHLE